MRPETKHEPLPVGTSVAYVVYGMPLHGVVTSDSGSGIIRVLDSGGSRERWLHRMSLTVTER